MANHLKRLASPKTWEVKRKGLKFITKPVPGPHNHQNSLSLNTLLKEILSYATTTRDVKKVLNTNEIRIDGKTRKDFRFPVGIFDTVEFPTIDEQFRMVINKNGKLHLVRISKEEAKIKPCKIVGKTSMKDKVQLNLYDGKNILAEKGPYKVGDSILISLPDNKIVKHLKFEKNSTIYLTGGRHIGDLGNVDDIIKDKVLYRDEKGNLIETSKEYAFVVGEDKLTINIK